MRNIFLSIIVIILASNIALSFNNGSTEPGLFNDNAYLINQINPIKIDSVAYNDMFRHSCSNNISFKEIELDSIWECRMIKDIFPKDSSAKYVYIEGPNDDPNFFYCSLSQGLFKETTIYKLEFCTPISKTVYLFYQDDDTVRFIDIKFDSAPIAISTNGYIACFKEVGDAMYVCLKIYKLEGLGKGEELNIRPVYEYSNVADEVPDKYWQARDAFWNDGNLYIKGYRTIETEERRLTDGYCYFKFQLKGIDNSK